MIALDNDSGLHPRTFACTVSSKLLGFWFWFFSLFFVSGPCARLSWPSRQLLSARKSTVSYRIVSYRIVMKLISKALRMARVKGITQFYLPSTRLSTNGMDSKPQSITPLWPVQRLGGWELVCMAGYIRSGMPARRRSLIPVPIVRRPGIELTTTESQVQRPNH